MDLEQCLKQYDEKLKEGIKPIRIDISNLSKEDKIKYKNERQKKYKLFYRENNLDVIKKWYDNNKDTVNEKKKIYRKNNPHKAKEYRIKNKEYIKEYTKNYTIKNKEKKKEYTKNYLENNKEIRKQTSSNYYNKNKNIIASKAHKKEIVDYRCKKSRWKTQGFKHTDEEFKEIFKRRQESIKCELCDTEYTSSRDTHTDHHHSSGSFRNICCNKCNKNRGVIDRKMDKVLLELHRYFFNNSIFIF